MQPKKMSVLITGACGGIGRALAKRFAESGANLHLTGRNPEALRRLSDELEKVASADQGIRTYQLDLSETEQLGELVRQLNRLESPINTLINNAGIAKFRWFEDQSHRDIAAQMHLNSVVPMTLTHQLLPMLKRQPEARVVNVASTFGAVGFPGYSVYSASKHALKGFSEALGRELSDSNITVGCFLPRATKTGINSASVVQLNRELKVAMDEPKLVAEALFQFACSRKPIEAFGWPEKLLVRLNPVFPSLIGRAIYQKLPLIKRHAKELDEQCPVALPNT